MVGVGVVVIIIIIVKAAHIQLESQPIYTDTLDIRERWNFCFVVQIAPLSFQTSEAHKPRQVRWGELHASVVTEWSLACLHK